MEKVIYFLTGSSGSGKTTLLKSIAEHLQTDMSSHHIDDSENLTLEKLFKNSINSSASKLILEGSIKPTDIKKVALQNGISQIKIVLIDCEHIERKRRLVEDRGQPELDNLDIYAWAAYLRGQADALGLDVIDTTSAAVEDSSSELFDSIDNFFAKI